jgi:hypothetical protein
LESIIMSELTGWDLVQTGDFDGAIKRLQEECSLRPSLGNRNNLGHAYLCKGDLAAAKTVFGDVKRDRPDSAGAFEWAGVVDWISGDQAAAVSDWQSSLNCQYQDAARGVGPLLLLYFASVRQQDKPGLRKTLDLLEERLNGPWSGNWPGPVGRFVLGLISEQQLRDHITGYVEGLQRRRSCQALFYAGVLALRDGNPQRFAESVKAFTGQRDWIFEREWHLANHEWKIAQSS